jgi:hypothetical protein
LLTLLGGTVVMNPSTCVEQTALFLLKQVADYLLLIHAALVGWLIISQPAR